MTQDNYDYRTSPLFLRNQFMGKGILKMPNVPKAELSKEDLDGLRLIGFDKVKNDKDEHYNRMVHFFLYDYKFEDVWKQPDNYVDTLKKYTAVLTPDFSMYIEMHPIMQIYNTFRNRWIGAYYAKQGIKMIPTVNWGLDNTFAFCFNGIEKGSPVAVSTYMVSAHGNHADQKEFFMKGYNEMLRRIEPSVIICYHYPFPEMKGNIVFVDYDLSSWRHESDDIDKSCLYTQSERYTLGLEVPPKDSNVTVKHYGYVLPCKGTGSAHGGQWQPNPNKLEDQRFLGEPGEIIRGSTLGKRGGYERETKIGDDGRAIRERHHSDHDNNKYHSNPHDHIVDWSNGFPRLEPDKNYFDGNVPEFKRYREGKSMTKNIISNAPEQNRFTSISDFKWCMYCGGEVEIEYNDRVFGILSKVKRTPESEAQILFFEKFVEHQEKTEKWCDNADEVLECMIGDVCLRNVITEVIVWDRTI